MIIYDKTNWINGETPLNADNMQKIEDGIEYLFDLNRDIPQAENQRVEAENQRAQQEAKRQSNEIERNKKVNDNLTTINNTKADLQNKVSAKIVEVDTKVNTKISEANSKINDVEARFQRLTSSQQQNAEVIDARDGETSLKARLDRDIEKAKQVYVNVEGSNISTDSSSGYLKDVEIKGNTIQNEENLADIRSVGEKVEGQELYEIPVLSCGKNLFSDYGKKIRIKQGTYKLTSKQTLGANRISFKLYDSNMNDITESATVDTKSSFYLTGAKVFNLSSDREILNETITLLSENINFIEFSYQSKAYIDAQLEEGTQATPYEPYQEDKLTILSPVQLEKVGDVRDRIIEKDGVYGVEKNIGNVIFDGSENEWVYENRQDTTSTYRYLFNSDIGMRLVKDALLSNLFITESTIFTLTGDLEGINSYTDGRIYVRVNKDRLESSSSSSFKKFLSENNLLVKYQLAIPTFIPLPHDQQVKLRTFANKTNISFLTEIEGTIKAQVPKSLGATVNTHTEQISNLNKELDRVKKLEESTVSTVETESDFTTVEATSNGYFEDVKLEGKTLVVNANNEVVEPGTEGATLKSVGQGTDEIVVSSVKGDGNLLIGIEKGTINNAGNCQDVTNVPTVRPIDFCRVSPGITYFFREFETSLGGYLVVHEYDRMMQFIKYQALGVTNRQFTVSSNCSYIKFRLEDSRGINYDDIKIQITEYDSQQFIPYAKSDKKRLLYYNNETQTWEKPILREWDSIEKHANGKYYYHQRSGEVVLNGSENWLDNGGTTNTKRCCLDVSSWKCKNTNDYGKSIVCDKFRVLDGGHYDSDVEHFYIDFSRNYLYIFPLLSKLPTQDLQGFKQWLQANNVTVVYQLAEEKVYECTNIDLITCEGETNYIVECGAIVPRSTLKVHNNISNVVSLLQKKVSLLESNMTKYMITQNRMQLASTYSADSVTFKVDYFSLCGDEENYDEDLYNLILNNILVGKDNYNYDKMFTMVLDYASWNQISWEQFDILVGLMDIQHNPPIEEIPTDDEIVEEIPNEIM